MVLKYGVMDSSNKAFLNTVGFDCTSYMFLDSRMIVLEKLVKLLTKTMAAHENNDFVIVGNDKIYRESNNSHNIVELPHLNQTDLRLINSK